MVNPEIKNRRARLNLSFGKLVVAALEVEQEMTGEPHERGIAYFSLKPKSGAYVVCSSLKNGFTALYTDETGQAYDISVHRTDLKPKN